MIIPKILNQLVVYALVGCVGVTIDFLVFNMLIFLKTHYIIANSISISLGIINNFFLNRRFTFNKYDNISKRLLSFFAVGIFGLLLSSLILFYNENYLFFNIMHVKIVTIVFVAVIQFILNKFISFS